MLAIDLIVVDLLAALEAIQGVGTTIAQCVLHHLEALVAVMPIVVPGPEVPTATTVVVGVAQDHPMAGTDDTEVEAR